MKKTGSKLFFLGVLSLMLAFALSNVAYGMEFADGRVTLNGFVKNWTAYRLGTYSHERGEGLSMFRNVLQLEAEAKVFENVSLYTIWKGAREPAYHLEDDAVAAGNFDEDIMNEEEFREYYLTWQATDRVWLKVGKQQVVWGDLGGVGLCVMDIINPLDLRWHYAVEDFETCRKPLTMINTIYSIPEADANIQFVWMPAIDEPWERVNSLYGNPGHRYGLNQVPAGSLFGPPASLTMDGSWADGGTVPGWGPDTFVPGVPEDDEADPPNVRRRLSDSTLAIRWQQTRGGFSYALMECYTYNHNPTYHWEGSPLAGAPLNIRYFRQNIIGFSFNWYDNRTGSVWRGEIGHFHDAPYTADKRLMIGANLNPDFYHLEKKDTIKFGFGCDRRTFLNWLSPTRSVMYNTQIIGTWILGHDDDMVVPGYNTEVKELDVLFTCFINWGWNADRAQINLYPAYNIDREWGYLGAWIDCMPSAFAGNLTITPKVHLFYGKDAYTGDFGLTRGCSEAVLEIKYEF